MEKTEKYIAQVKTSRQISPDDWELWTPTVEVTENMTVKELVQKFLDARVAFNELDQIQIVRLK